MPSKDGEPQTWRETLSLKSTKSEVHTCEFVACLGFLDWFSRQNLLLREGVLEPYQRRQLLGGLPSAQSKQRERQVSYGLREDRTGRGRARSRKAEHRVLTPTSGPHKAQRPQKGRLDHRCAQQRSWYRRGRRGPGPHAAVGGFVWEVVGTPPSVAGVDLPQQRLNSRTQPQRGGVNLSGARRPGKRLRPTVPIRAVCRPGFGK